MSWFCRCCITNIYLQYSVDISGQFLWRYLVYSTDLAQQGASQGVKHVWVVGADQWMYGTVLLLRCCCKLESCGTVLLFNCCKLRSCIVVLLYCLFLCWLGKSSTVLFLVVSGKSSTVLAVLYYFLTWYTNLGTRKQKRNEGLQFSKSSFIARAPSRSKIAPAIRCSVVDIKRTGDMTPLKRVRLRSHAANELKANRSMRAREQRANVNILNLRPEKYRSIAWVQAVFVLSLVLPLEGPPKLSLRWARRLTTSSFYFVFHCNNQLLLHFSISARRITAWHRARTRASWGTRAAEFDRSMESWYHRYSTQGTAGKAECDTRWIPLEHLARPISQACTGIAVQPAVSVLVPLRAHLQQMLKHFCASRNPRASLRRFHAKN